MNNALNTAFSAHSFASVGDVHQKALEDLLENIRQMRIRRNLSQETMGNELDMDRSNYAKLENGNVELSVYRFFRIAAIFKIHPVALLTGQLDMVNETGLGYVALREKLNAAEKNEQFWKDQFANLSLEHHALQKQLTTAVKRKSK